jgi:tetratricopeptide (TPR) repeat protein
MSSTTVDDALRYHRLGDHQNAEKAYREILTRHPNHADALHLYGMLLHNRGQNDQAEKLIRRAIAIQTNQSVYCTNLGIVLSAMGKLDDAIAAYRKADQLNPNSPETLNNLGVALHANGAFAEAVECLKRSVILRPDYFDAINNLVALLNLDAGSAAANHVVGDILHSADRSKDAIQFYRKAIDENPESAETYSNLGNALFAIDEPAEALLNYQKALQLKPDFPQAWNNLANALKEFDRLNEAIAAYRRAMELQPNTPEPLSNLGNALRDAGQWESAMELYQKALDMHVSHAVTHNNVGNALCERGEWWAAISAYEKALAIKPDYADAINNMGTAMEEIGQRDRAMQCYQQAHALTPKAVSPPWNIALLQLLQGDYIHGWRGYENRWRQKKQSKTWRAFNQPMLSNVAQMKGSRILLHAEQGFGDAIQFCRYATMVAEQGATVYLECPPKLSRLFSTLKEVKKVIPRGEELPEFDLHCPLMSLPMVFGTEIKTVPGTVSYLSADPADVLRWQKQFADQPDAYRVGLVWAGQSTHQKDRHRSLSLHSFAGLSLLPGVRFYSLQVGDSAGQAKSPPQGMELVDWTSGLNDFADTAAMISQLDLVISVDTAVCHLAGALGKPVWVLVAFQPDWRWLLDRDDSPWYPTAKLFRQPSPQDWGPPLSKIAAELAAILSDEDPRA